MQSYDQQINALQAKLSAYSSIEVPRAGAWALNRAGNTAKSRTVKGVSKALSLPQKEVRKRVYVAKASSKSLKVRVRNYYRGVSVAQLKARDTGKGGWSTRKGRGVRASGGRHYPNAFIGRGMKGNRHVFERDGSKRLPLKALRVEIRKEVDASATKIAEQVLRDVFPKDLAHDLARRLKKYEV